MNILCAFILLLSPMTATTATIDLPEALSLALAHAPELQASRARSQAAVFQRKSLRGRYGPRVEADLKAMHWDDNSEVDVIDVESLDLSEVPELFVEPLSSLMTQLAQPLELRQQNTLTFSLSLVQPITPLYQVYQGHQIGQSAERIAHIREQAQRRSLVFETTRSYLLLLQAEELSRVTHQAEEAIAAHVQQARNFEAGGMIAHEQVLAAQVELASATQRRIQAEEALSLARSQLARFCGLPMDQPLAPKALPTFAEGPLPWSLEQAQGMALASRKEIKLLKEKETISERRERMAWWDLTPQLAAVARYQHNEGLDLEPSDEFFVGAVLQWSLWEWGKDYYEARAHGAESEAARAQRAEVASKLKLQVKQRYLALDSARQQVQVARRAVQQAEEAQRLESLRFAQGLSTNTGVLDAQTRLSAARARQVVARSKVWESWIQLKLALGAQTDPTITEQDLKQLHGREG
mgnify:CR=1 FL=1